MSDFDQFTANQLLFIDWLATPKYSRMPATQQQFADSIGVHDRTCTRWRKMDGLQAAVTRRAREMLQSDLPDIYGSIAHEAKSGSYQHAKLALELTGQYTPASTVEHMVQVPGLDAALTKIYGDDNSD